MERTGFNISIAADVYLTIKEIWPDGDAPENPTPADVKAAMEACGSKMRTLRDWELLQDVDVSVDGEQVWA